jgi:spore coat polysaccharide biosynthesis predicted glycosyltransferase SpsG
LIRRAAEGAGHNIEVLAGVEDMAPLMAWADVAVSAGGTTVWELAFMGVPALLCIVADNQEGAVGALGRDGVFRSAGWVNRLTDEELSDELANLIYGKDLRNAIHNRARAIVDGKGAARVAGELQLAEVK